MIARVLNLCGLHLGRADDLIPPGPDNPDGFWEHRHFVAINDALLAAFGGTWDAPPSLPPGWHEDPKLTPAYRRAAELIREFRGSSGWGWKDPRNSLTLPFWRHLLPDMRVVVCLRNPLEVAASLRDGKVESLLTSGFGSGSPTTTACSAISGRPRPSSPTTPPIFMTPCRRCDG